MTCVCGKGSKTEDCCRPYLAGDRIPETAEDLMRSRYSAYALGEIDYILKTHDPETVDQADRREIEQWSQKAKWLGLEIIAKEQGGKEDQEGTVEFVARYEYNGQEVAHHERAIFRKIDGKWFFVDGEMVKKQPVVIGKKTGRNEPCPCGSGKKYKKCCLAKQEAVAKA